MGYFKFLGASMPPEVQKALRQYQLGIRPDGPKAELTEVHYGFWQTLRIRIRRLFNGII